MRVEPEVTGRVLDRKNQHFKRKRNKRNKKYVIFQILFSKIYQQSLEKTEKISLLSALVGLFQNLRWSPIKKHGFRLITNVGRIIVP